jgi:hypothetical protein
MMGIIADLPVRETPEITFILFFSKLTAITDFRVSLGQRITLLI